MESKDKNMEPGIGETLKNDFKKGGHKKNFEKEWHELKEFNLNKEKQKKLESMNLFMKFFYTSGWLFKSLFLNLTALRRLLLIVAIIFILSPGSATINGDRVTTQNNVKIIGGAVLLLVLMLEIKDRITAQTELHEGRSVQQSLMSEEKPNIPGWSLWLYTMPAHEVGGDMVDFRKCRDEKYCISVSDVSGKGLAAAMLMAKLQATLRALQDYHTNIVELIKKLNEIFYRDTMKRSFASMCYIELKPNDKNIRFINAGHLPPLVINSGSITQLKKNSPALGLMQDANFLEQNTELDENSIFVVYSDGLTEARNEDGEFFGEKRLLNFLINNKSHSPETTGKRLVDIIEQFNGDNPLNDDLSIAILKREI